MKALKAFIITLAIILAVGTLAIVGSAVIKKRNNTGSSAGNNAESSSGTSEAKSDSTVTKSKPKRKSNANPVTKALVNEALDSYISSSDEKTQEVFDSMSEEDKDVVVDILADSISLGSIADLTGYIASGDENALTEYAEDNISSEDQEELLDILSKYGIQP